MKKIILSFVLLFVTLFSFAQADRNNEIGKEEPFIGSSIRFINAQEVTVHFENGNFSSKFDVLYCKNKSSNYFGIMFVVINGEKTFKEIEIPYIAVKRVEGKIE